VILGAAAVLLTAVGVGAVIYINSRLEPPLTRIPVALRQDCKDYGYYYWSWDTTVPSDAFNAKKLCYGKTAAGDDLFVPLARMRSSSELDKQYESMLRALTVREPSRRYRTSRTSGRLFIGKDDNSDPILVWTDEPGRVIGTVSYLISGAKKPEALIADWRRHVVLGSNLRIAKSSKDPSDTGSEPTG